jgi:hypothetical protein
MHQCAHSETDLTPSCRRQPDWWRQVAYTGTKLLYQPEPKPVVYIVPVHHILGRLALVPYGAHGTIPYDWHQLQLSHYRRGACVITVKGQAVGANSSTSTPGPWYGRQTIPVTLKRHNVHRGVHCGFLVHTGLFHILIVHTVFADTSKTVKLTSLCNQLDVWDEPKGSLYNEQSLRFCAIF